jgi:hypothetical protein
MDQQIGKFEDKIIGTESEKEKIKLTQPKISNTFLQQQPKVLI